MYFKFNLDKIYTDFPILNSNVDCIIDFFSLDLVKDMEFNMALYAVHEEAYHRLFEFVFQNKISFGKILPYSKSTPIIMQIPVKEKINTVVNTEYLMEGLLKFSENYNKLNIKTVGIQETSFIKKETILSMTQDIDFPEILFFTKNVLPIKTKMEKKNATN